jgi:GDPmannose 4,6-dehydratase
MEQMKTILITGILGQDGSNLAEYLLNNNPEVNVVGVYKRGSNPNIDNIKTIINRTGFKLVSGDITDQTSMDNLVIKHQPDYLVNFAANSFVGTSWDTPDQVFAINTLGVLKCLEAIRKFKPDCKFYSAGSSEEFGDIKFIPQTEDHPIIPVSPYAAAKAAARHLVDIYRRSYGIFAIHGTLFNHEGPRRGVEFVTRKITMNIARICREIELGIEIKPFSLGNVYASKDWTDSRDMVRGIWMMLQQDAPVEYILASNKTRTIKEFVDAAFYSQGFNGKWNTNEDPLKETYSVELFGRQVTVITIDKKLYRATEVGIQKGDYSKIKAALGWEPEISFETMVKEMIDNDKSLIS